MYIWHEARQARRADPTVMRVSQTPDRRVDVNSSIEGSFVTNIRRAKSGRYGNAGKIIQTPFPLSPFAPFPPCRRYARSFSLSSFECQRRMIPSHMHSDSNLIDQINLKNQGGLELVFLQSITYL